MEIQMCPLCLERTYLRPSGNCPNCDQATHIIEVLSRAEVLSHTNDGTEYETPVMEAEMVG